MCFFGSSHLPFANGPNIPGCVDIMTEYSKDGLFFRLYYPTDEKNPIEWYKKDWPTWIPHFSYVRGFAKVVMTWLIVLKLIFWFVSGTLHIPAVYGARIKKGKKLKCIIFSHGLGGSRFLYSSTCIELASRGFLVAIIEHRDDSAGCTYYYESPDDVKCDKRAYINYVPIKLGPTHYTARNSQIKKRAEECTKLLNLIKNMNEGNIPTNILKDLPNDQRKDFDSADLEGNIDFEDLTMMGHSFGGATALVTLYKNKETLRRGIILDAWMFPIKDMLEVHEIDHSLIFINTQTFHITSNFKIMEDFVHKNEEIRPVYTILHTTHENQTDTVFVAGSWQNLFMKKLTAGNAIKINNSIILSFLNKQTEISCDISDCEDYLLKQSESFVSGIDALKHIISIPHTTVVKMFNQCFFN